MKHGLNRIKIKLFTQQMGWLGGEGGELQPWGQMRFVVVNVGILIKYFVLSRLLRLDGYLGKPTLVD
jgi:hypothetical protein